MEDVRSKPKLDYIFKSFGLVALRGLLRFFDSDTRDGTALRSQLGTLVYSRLQFPFISYVDADGDTVEIEPVKTDAALFSVIQSKQIVTTAIQGRSGTVKEYFSEGDYQITIRGAMINRNPSRYPQADVDKILAVCKSTEAVPIENSYLNDVFGITDIVITSFSFPQSEGNRGAQAFEINAISDSSFELEL